MTHSKILKIEIENLNIKQPQQFRGLNPTPAGCCGVSLLRLSARTVLVTPGWSADCPGTTLTPSKTGLLIAPPSTPLSKMVCFESLNGFRL